MKMSFITPDSRSAIIIAADKQCMLLLQVLFGFNPKKFRMLLILS